MIYKLTRLKKYWYAHHRYVFPKNVQYRLFHVTLIDVLIQIGDLEFNRCHTAWMIILGKNIIFIFLTMSKRKKNNLLKKSYIMDLYFGVVVVDPTISVIRHSICHLKKLKNTCKKTLIFKQNDHQKPVEFSSLFKFHHELKATINKHSFKINSVWSYVQ